MDGKETVIPVAPFMRRAAGAGKADAAAYPWLNNYQVDTFQSGITSSGVEFNVNLVHGQRVIQFSRPTFGNRLTRTSNTISRAAKAQRRQTCSFIWGLLGVLTFIAGSVYTIARTAQWQRTKYDLLKVTDTLIPNGGTESSAVEYAASFALDRPMHDWPQATIDDGRAGPRVALNFTPTLETKVIATANALGFDGFDVKSRLHVVALAQSACLFDATEGVTSLTVIVTGTSVYVTGVVLAAFWRYMASMNDSIRAGRIQRLHGKMCERVLGHTGHDIAGFDIVVEDTPAKIMIFVCVFMLVMSVVLGFVTEVVVGISMAAFWSTMMLVSVMFSLQTMLVVQRDALSFVKRLMDDMQAAGIATNDRETQQEVTNVEALWLK